MILLMEDEYIPLKQDAFLYLKMSYKLPEFTSFFVFSNSLMCNFALHALHS